MTETRYDLLTSEDGSPLADELIIEELEQRATLEVHGACACTCSCDCSSCSCIVWW